MDQVTKDLLERIQHSLQEAGVKDEPVGRRFIFHDNSGHHIIGTVTSSGGSEEEGVVLYVSAPRFGGVSILYLRYDPNQASWLGVGEGERTTKGTFSLVR